MLNTLRNVTFIKAMMWIVALAFIGLIVFEWGADISGRGTGRVGDTVGIVNGQKISHKHFDSVLRNAYRQAKDRGEADPELGGLVRQVWDYYVDELLYAQQIEKYNISVSDREVDFYNRRQPVAAVQNQEAFQTDGKFDPAKYARVLDDPNTYTNPGMKEFILSAEHAVRQNLLQNKVRAMVANAVRVTDPEVRDAYVRQNEKVRVAYAGVEVSAIPDSLVSVSEADIQDAYDAWKEEYHQDASVRASFVSFPKTPSAADESEIEAEIRRLLADIRGGEDFAGLAQEYSDDPGSARKGGDLGFFGRGQMVKAFEDTAFSLSPGAVSEPFRTQFGWHIVRTDSTRGAADSLQVRARHILLKVGAGRNTLDSLRMEAEEFVDRTEEVGFDAAATGMGLTTGDTGFITAGGFFPLLGNRTSGLVNAFLESSPGKVSPTYETEQGIYIFMLRETRPAGPQPLEEVRSQVLRKLKQQKQVALAAERAAGILDGVRSGKSLKEAAESLGLKYTESAAFSRTGFVPGVGGRNAFIGAAFRLKSGEVSEVVTTDRGAYVLQVLERQPIDESEFEKEKEALAQRLLSQKRNEVVTAWFGSLRENAEIVDNRHHFYTDF